MPRPDPASAAQTPTDIPPSPSAESRRITTLDCGLAAAFFGLGLTARFPFLSASHDRAWPHSAWFEGDAPLWAQWAGTIAKGEEFEHGLAIHTPAVAYLLRWLGFTAESHDFTMAKVLWCVVSAMACGLTFLALRLELSRKVAAIAALMLSFSFASYLTATSLNGEGLYTALLPILVIGTLRLARSPSFLIAAAFGVV